MTTTSSPGRSCALTASSVAPTAPALSWHTTTTASADVACMSARDGQIPRDPSRLGVAPWAEIRFGLEDGDSLLQHAQLLGENLVLVREARDHEGEVQE